MRFVGGLLVVVSVFAVACSGSPAVERPDVNARDCNLPSPRGNAELSEVPEPFLPIDGSTLVHLEDRRGRKVFSLIAPTTVDDGLAAYRKAIENADITILQEDYEGFEGEFYIQSPKGVGIVQVRASNCDDKVLVLLNLP